MTRRVPSSRLLFVLLLGAACTLSVSTHDSVAVRQSATSPAVALPNRESSLKFAVLGDFGNGSREQFQLAEQMVKLRTRFPYELVLTVGDNIYGSDSERSLRERFEVPYKPLLDAGVKFYASLGNHDTPEFQRHYALFNMGGDLYYTFKAPSQDVRFFALQSEYMTVQQIGWLEKELTDSGEDWKIPYFHHPLYSSGERHGANLPLRSILEPMFAKHDVSVAFTGHDHIYERTLPQHGIVYFVAGSGGQLRRGGLDRQTGITASGNDTDRIFMAVEIDGDELFFNAISQTGRIVDSGVITRKPSQ